jgi:hypothetical protein
MPFLSMLELLLILLYLGHIAGCFFYLMSTPLWQTASKPYSGLRATTIA